jgi:hypothetical protein
MAIKLGARMDSVDYNGRSYLHQALMTKQINMLETLVQLGVPLSTKNADGYDAVFAAAMNPYPGKLWLSTRFLYNRVK